MSIEQPTLLRIYEKMLLSRVLDEIISQPRILGNPFYIGSAFEEPTVVVGMMMKVGSGLDFDVVCTHYRSLPILIGMGIEADPLFRQAAMRDTDPWSKGRQMLSHFSEPDLNIAPMSSPVAVQAGKAYGIAHTQKMLAKSPVLTVCHLGDAMCAEADFWVMLQEIALKELPVLVLISNNGAGIHTPYEQGSAAACQSAWGVSCQIATSSRPEDEHLKKYVESYCPTLSDNDVKYVSSPKDGWKIVDGSDVLSLYHSTKIAFDYIRENRKPFILEYRSERGRHHSSSSNPSGQILEPVQTRDPLPKFEQQLIEQKILTRQQMDKMRQELESELHSKIAEIKKEPPATDWQSGLYYAT